MVESSNMVVQKHRVLTLLLVVSCVCISPCGAQITVGRHNQEVTGCAALHGEDWAFELSSRSGQILALAAVSQARCKLQFLHQSCSTALRLSATLHLTPLCFCT